MGRTASRDAAVATMDVFPEMGDDPFSPPRFVVYEPAASRHIDQQSEHFPRLPDVMRYIEWQLARFPGNPYALQMPFPNTDIWLF